MRCPDCNKFVGNEELEPEMQDISIDDKTVTAEVRIVNACSECGTELTEATFDMEGEIDIAAHQCNLQAVSERKEGEAKAASQKAEKELVAWERAASNVVMLDKPAPFPGNEGTVNFAVARCTKHEREMIQQRDIDMFNGCRECLFEGDFSGKRYMVLNYAGRFTSNRNNMDVTVTPPRGNEIYGVVKDPKTGGWVGKRAIWCSNHHDWVAEFCPLCAHAYLEQAGLKPASAPVAEPELEESETETETEFEVEETGTERTNRVEGKGRGARTFYGASVDFTVKCAVCNEVVATGQLTDEVQASGMDSLV